MCIYSKIIVRKSSTDFPRIPRLAFNTALFIYGMKMICMLLIISAP